MSTIIGRMRQYLSDSQCENYIGINYLDDAINAVKKIKETDYEPYADSDYYSPLLYKLWGEILVKKGTLNSYSIEIKNYRYVLNGIWGNNQEIILGTDALLSINKYSGSADIRDFRYAGGFALWPSHRGGINFRKNRYNDDIFLTLEDIEKYYIDKNKYKGVIPQADFKWFDNIGDFKDMFFFEDYGSYKGDLMLFEKVRTEKMISFLLEN